MRAQTIAQNGEPPRTQGKVAFLLNSHWLGVGSAHNKTSFSHWTDGSEQGHSYLTARETGLPTPGPQQNLRLSLAGVFTLEDGNGQIVPLTSVMSRRLLAILLRSPSMARSRTQLQLLLWDDTASNPANGLRQLVLQTRARLGPHGSCLKTDATTIRLSGVEDVTLMRKSSDIAFFEDAGFGAEDFEDWLRDERMIFDEAERVPAPALLPTPALRTVATLPRVTFRLHNQTTAARATDELAQLGAGTLAHLLSQSEFLEFYDLRLSEMPPGGANLEVAFQVLPCGALTELTVAAVSAGRVVWSHTMQITAQTDAGDQRQSVVDFARTGLSAIERCLTQINHATPGQQVLPPLYVLVEQLFTMDPVKVQAAASALEHYDESHVPASILAWRGFARMLQSGERLVDDRAAARAQAKALINAALDADPMRPSALTIAAHYRAFVSRDYAGALDLSDAGIDMAPSSPLAHDVRATLALYQDDLGKAGLHAREAATLGRFSPLRHYLAATGMMLHTVEGRHDRAVAEGQAILSARPNFLPVMRHLAASLAETGNLDGAHAMIARIRAIDPCYATRVMEGADYPLPSQTSRTRIIDALRKFDLFDKDIKT